VKTESSKSEIIVKLITIHIISMVKMTKTGKLETVHKKTSAQNHEKIYSLPCPQNVHTALIPPLLVLVGQSCKRAELLGQSQKMLVQTRPEPKFDLRPSKQARKSPKVMIAVLNTYSYITMYVSGLRTRSNFIRVQVRVKVRVL